MAHSHQRGRRQIDRRKIRAEERLDGRRLLSTSDPGLSVEDVTPRRKNLREAELRPALQSRLTVEP